MKKQAYQINRDILINADKPCLSADRFQDKLDVWRYNDTGYYLLGTVLR